MGWFGSLEVPVAGFLMHGLAPKMSLMQGTSPNCPRWLALLMNSHIRIGGLSRFSQEFRDENLNNLANISAIPKSFTCLCTYRTKGGVWRWIIVITCSVEYIIPPVKDGSWQPTRLLCVNHQTIVDVTNSSCNVADISRTFKSTR